MTRGRRSHACLTCLRRKKGCDQQKPACGQCRKAAINCEGYSRPLVFKATRVPPLPRESEFPAAAGTLIAGDAHVHDHDASILQPDSLTRSAYQTRLIDLFWRSYLPNGRALPREVARISVGGWIDAVQQSQHAGHVLTKALLALSLALVGRLDKTPWMTVEGQRLYGGALHDMTSALNPIRKPRGDKSMLATTTVRLLSLFEAMQIKDTERQLIEQAASWQVHNTGGIALLRTNPLSFYATGVAHRLFVDGQMHLIITALRSRKKSFLGESKWRTIPWTHQAKTLKIHLLDILVDIPTLYERVDTYALSPNRQTGRDRKASERKSDINARQTLITACHDLEARLTRWHSIYAAPYEAVCLDPDAADYNSAQAIGAAHILTVYWIACLLALTELRDLLLPIPSQEGDPSTNSAAENNDSTRTSPESSTSTTPADPPPDALRAHILSDLYCHNIVRTFSVFMHPSTGMFRVHFATFPLAVVVRHFHMPGSEGRLGRERELVDEYLEMPECATMAQFIRSLKPENTRSKLSWQRFPAAGGGTGASAVGIALTETTNESVRPEGR